jgi:hypothetical protein
MLRCLRIGLVTAALLLLMTSATSDAAQVTVTQVDRKADGTVTYHFSVKVGQTETMEPGNGDALPADFFTIYNFYGLVDGSVNTPDGWKFTSEESGRTPAMGEYRWCFRWIFRHAQYHLDGDGTREARNRGHRVLGCDPRGRDDRRDVFRDGNQRSGPIQGASGSPGSATMVSKQAQIGMITTPSFLADLKK